MAYPTPAEIDAAVPVDGTPNRALTNAALKSIVENASYMPDEGTVPVRSVGNENFTGGRLKAAPATDPDDVTVMAQVESAIGLAANFSDAVRTTKLAGLNIQNAPVTASDSVLSAAGKIQGQLDNRPALDASGRLPVSVLPTTTLVYKGMWSASTNTPTLSDAMPGIVAGDFYQVNSAGDQDLGSGVISYSVGDQVFFNGSYWERSIASNAVANVNGQTGAVELRGDNLPYDGNGSATIKEVVDLRIPERLSVTGSITAAGERVFLTIGNVEIGVEWLNAASLRQYVRAVSGTETVDLRRLNVWGVTALDSGAYDNRTLTETPLVIDVEMYDDSNETLMHTLREGGRVWQIGGFFSGNGTRCALWAERKA